MKSSFGIIKVFSLFEKKVYFPTVKCPIFFKIMLAPF